MEPSLSQRGDAAQCVTAGGSSPKGRLRPGAAVSEPVLPLAMSLGAREVSALAPAPRAARPRPWAETAESQSPDGWPEECEDERRGSEPEDTSTAACQPTASGTVGLGAPGKTDGNKTSFSSGARRSQGTFQKSLSTTLEQALMRHVTKGCLHLVFAYVMLKLFFCRVSKVYPPAKCMVFCFRAVMIKVGRVRSRVSWVGTRPFVITFVTVLS